MSAYSIPDSRVFLLVVPLTNLPHSNGKFSEFLGLKSTHRSSMCDSTVSSCLSTRVAKPVYDDPATAFNRDPELAEVFFGRDRSEPRTKGIGTRGQASILKF